MSVFNLGRITGSLASETAPTDLNVIWEHITNPAEPNVRTLKIYDHDQELWIPLGQEIGPPESGATYDSGYWNDLDQTTRIGIVVDRVNKLLKSHDDILNALIPPNPPALSSASIDTSGAGAKLSFDASNPIGGYTDAETIPSGGGAAVAVDEEFENSGNRKGAIAKTGGNIGGVLNDQVAAHDYSYPADSFPDGNKGELILEINGVDVDTRDLTTESAQDGTSGGTTSGLNISAATAVEFANETEFTTRKYRTGTFNILRSDLVNGYNYIRIRHVVDGATIRTTQYFEFIADADGNAVSFSNEALDNFIGSGSKFVSGIEYFTDGDADYDVDIDNAYRNCYSPDADAISHGGTKTTVADAALGNNAGNELLQISIANKTVDIADLSRLNPKSGGTISVTTTVKHPVKGNQTSAGASIADIVAEKGVMVADTALIAYLNDEVYRVPSNADTSAHANLITGMWDEEMSLKNGGAGYNDGLQLINGAIYYPTDNFSTIGDITKNLNFGNSDLDYSALTGDRSWARWFRQASPSTANFRIKVDGDGAVEFVPLGTSLSGQKAHLEFKAPGETGWMDGYAAFVSGQYADGDGAQNIANGAGGINQWLGLTIGTKNTANTDGKVIVRITVSSGFTSKITQVEIQYL